MYRHTHTYALLPTHRYTCNNHSARQMHRLHSMTVMLNREVEMEECRDPCSRKLPFAQFPRAGQFPVRHLSNHVYQQQASRKKYQATRIHNGLERKQTKKKWNNTKQNMQRHLRHGELPVKLRTKQIVWLLTRSAWSISSLWPVSWNLSKWKSLLEFLMHQSKEPCWNTSINHPLTALGGIQAQFFTFECLTTHKRYWRRTTTETVQWAIKLWFHKWCLKFVCLFVCFNSSHCLYSAGSLLQLRDSFPVVMSFLRLFV